MAFDIDLTVVGSINADISAVTERLPGPGETVGGGRLTREAGGKGANQAAAAARLGARTRMVGAVGSDADGAAMRRALELAGVDLTHVATVDTETGTALIVVDAAGENQIAVCEGANAHVSIEGVEVGEHDTVLAQLEISLDTVTELARRCRGYLALNAAPAMPLPAELIDRADLIIVNETEYELIPELADASLVAVTYGAQGSAILEHGTQVAFADAVKTTPVNTVGAGDAFCAALTIALRAGVPYEAALRTANAVGAAAVVDPASQPALQRLEQYAPIA
ncbi:PfkB family carbohydrate kinase [Paramicrobacterium agarici]|uniref:PfkB family carbohydrate kinase n=1 Tax=Paramicrobacterium agarici TaxID=630514 RepID=UPI00116B2740|nr:PfkB family carbohydrate kinase [Microbacterium agarici]TQO22874.1 ribokinase [Microbacterium agarici]